MLPDTHQTSKELMKTNQFQMEVEAVVASQKEEVWLFHILHQETRVMLIQRRLLNQYKNSLNINHQSPNNKILLMREKRINQKNKHQLRNSRTLNLESSTR